MGRIKRASLPFVVVSLLATAPARAKVETLTPGWDSFPPLTSGTVEWTVTGGVFEVTYTLDGAEPSHTYLAGMHHMDATGPIAFGGGTTSTSTGPDAISREGNLSAVVDTTFGFVTTDANGDATQTFQITPNAGTYAVQFHLRAGGPPGCPVTSCNAAYRTGAVFAENLSRIVVPGAVSFWGADGSPDSGDGTTADSARDNDLVANGTVAYRPGHFRDGFDLGGAGYLSVVDPAAAGLASASGFSVAAWVEQDVAGTAAASIVNLRTASNAGGFTLEPQYQTAGSILFGVNTSGVSQDYTLLSAAGFPIGQRSWVAASFDGASHTMLLFRDGALVARRTDVPGSNLALVGTEAFQIGRNVVAGSTFDGVLDDVVYFDHAVSPAELRAEGGWLFADGFELGDITPWSTSQPVPGE